MSTADLIAKIFMVLGPVIVVIGVVVFIYKNKAQWDEEIKALQSGGKKQTDSHD
ncbi:MAG: hypothetical protein LAT53_07310 [Idiomarina sp.]|nr:hypothetical protein [Idiomarina sp.]